MTRCQVGGPAVQKLGDVAKGAAGSCRNQAHASAAARATVVDGVGVGCDASAY